MLQSLVKSMSLVVLMRGSGIALQLLWFILLVRLLPMEQVGLYSVVNSIWLLTRALGPLGQESALIKEGGPLWRDGEKAQIRGLLDYALTRSRLILTLLLLPILLGAPYLLSEELMAISNMQLAVFIGVMGYVSFGLYSSALLVPEKQIAAHAPESILLPLSLMGMTLWMAQEEVLNFERLIFFQAVLSIVISVIYLFLVRRYLGKDIPVLMEDKTRQAFKQLSKRLFGTLALNNLNVRLPVILSPMLIGAAGTALLEAAIRFASLLGVIQWCIAFVISPKLSKVDTEKEPETLQKLLTLGCWLVFLPALGLFGFFLLFGEWMLGFIAGGEYQAAYLSLLIIAFGYLLNTLSGPTTHFYMMLGHEKQACRISAYETALSITLLGVLGYLYGLNGMAFAIMAGLAFRNGWLNLRLYPLTGLHSGVWSIDGWKTLMTLPQQLKSGSWR